MTDARVLRIRNRLRAHVSFGAVCAVAIALSFILSADTEGAALFGWELPPLCVFSNLFGRDCPGCGLTRSWVMAAHGDVRGAFEMHLLGPVMWVAAAAQVPYRALQVWRLRRELSGMVPAA